jgi:hypothetical protein
MSWRSGKPRLVLLFGNTAVSIDNCTATGLATTGGGYPVHPANIQRRFIRAVFV